MRHLSPTVMTARHFPTSLPSINGRTRMLGKHELMLAIVATLGFMALFDYV